MPRQKRNIDLARAETNKNVFAKVAIHNLKNYLQIHINIIYMIFLALLVLTIAKYLLSNISILFLFSRASLYNYSAHLS